MAAPTVVTYDRQIGRKGVLQWNSLSSDTTNHTTVVVLDLSAMADGYTGSVAIERIRYVCTAGIEFTLLYDATSNETILTSVLGSTEIHDIDFTWGGRDGVVKTAAGSTGDVVITTTSAGAADEIDMTIWYRVS